MSPFTFIAGGVLLCALVGAFTNQHYSWIVLGCAALGSWLPHWLEHPQLTERFGPQTMTHSLLGLAAVGVFLSPLCWLAADSRWLIAVLLGYAAHLLLDAASDQGVLLFYPSRARAVLPRHPLSRVTPGSPRETRLRWWLLGLWFLALPLNAIGLRGLLHRLIPVVQFAVEDYVTYSSKGRRVFAEFTGRFNTSQRMVSGLWEVLEASSRTSLLIEDPEGVRYTLGTHPQDTIQAFSVRARKGLPIDVQLQVMHLHEQPLGDLLSTIPSEGRTYLLGVLKTPEIPPLSFAIDQFRTIQAGASQIELRYATMHDLQAQRLAGLYVTDGDVLFRTLKAHQHRQAVAPDAPVQLIRSELPHKTVSVTIRHVHDPQEILVQPDQKIRQGQLLADLRSYRSTLLAQWRTLHAQHAGAQAALERLRLKQEQELSLKRREDTLAGVHRALETFQAQQAQDLLRAQSAADATRTKLDRLDRLLAVTELRSPISGRVLFIRLHQSTATIRLLAHD